MSEVEVEALRKAALNIPDAERSPQMDLLLWSFEGRNEAMQLLESESEVTRLKGMLTFLKAMSQGAMAVEVVPPDEAAVRMVLQHTMFDQDSGLAVRDERGRLELAPWTPGSEHSPSKLLGALAAGIATGCTYNLRHLALALLASALRALWPELSVPAVDRQLEAQNWVPYGAQTAAEAEAAAPAQAMLDAAPASSSSGSPDMAAAAASTAAAATRAALAAWLQQHCPEVSLEDVWEWALVAHMTTIENIQMRDKPTGTAARRLTRQYLRDSWHLMHSRRPGGVSYAYHVAVHWLSGPSLGSIGGEVADWERMADEGIAYCRQHRCWYPAAQIMWRRGMLLASHAAAAAEAAQESAQRGLQRRGSLTQRQQQAISKALQELPGMVTGMLEAEGKVKPWLPKPIMKSLSNSRKGLEEGLRSLRGSGAVSMNKLLNVKVSVQTKRCAYCSRQSLKLKLCSGCQSVAFCSRESQLADWRAGHKQQCAALAAAKQQQQQEQR